MTRLSDRLSPEEKRILVEYLSSPSENRWSPTAKDPSLWGIWREHFPANFDLDAALDEIRTEWKKEWPQVFDQ